MMSSTTHMQKTAAKIDEQHRNAPSQSDKSRPISRPKGIYNLRRYTWRSILTLFGPLVLLGFYSFICRQFLLSPPVNDIIPQPVIDAQWVYYIWFITAIFALDWARTGLANIESAALMHPRLAPKTASGLMWHTDAKWSNPLWWLRAIRFVIIRLLQRIRVYKVYVHNGPNILWLVLSLSTISFYLALALSGLTMEISNISVFTDIPAGLTGPNRTTFNNDRQGAVSDTARNRWLSGRAVIPPTQAILYAPQGNVNATSTYFDDQANGLVDSIQVFAGPAVEESIHGRAFGLSANISCKPVKSKDLQILQIHDVRNYSVKACTRHDNGCSIGWNNAAGLSNYESPTPDLYSPPLIPFPFWCNASGITSDPTREVSFIVAADGWRYWTTYWTDPPYSYAENHDNSTFDHVVNGRSLEDTTTGVLEFFIWQTQSTTSELPASLLANNTDLIEVKNATLNFLSGTRPWAGIGVHCDVTSAVGYAYLDPAHQTFSSFVRSDAPTSIVGGNATSPADPLQMLAYKVFDSFTPDADLASIYSAIHGSINSPTLSPTEDVDFFHVDFLTPKGLQLSMYKLLGWSMISMMDQNTLNPWYGELYKLGPTRYITPGVVSCIYVLVLLSIWTLMISGGALWLLTFAGPRWAPALGGFEMFQLGAHYLDDMNDLEDREFQDCEESLKRIPGMIGMLPGEYSAGSSDEKLGFIGLSENVAEKEATYTLDRRKAVGARIVV